MRRRRNYSKISSKLVEYLVDSRGLSQTDLATILGVDKSFISRVRSGERELSPTQMDMFAQHLNVPLGAMLIDAGDWKRVADKPHPHQDILDLCRKLMLEADDALKALREENKDRHAARR